VSESYFYFYQDIADIGENIDYYLLSIAIGDAILGYQLNYFRRSVATNFSPEKFWTFDHLNLGVTVYTVLTRGSFSVRVSVRVRLRGGNLILPTGRIEPHAFFSLLP
jgi:hypothetical protein